MYSCWWRDIALQNSTPWPIMYEAETRLTPPHIVDSLPIWDHHELILAMHCIRASLSADVRTYTELLGDFFQSALPHRRSRIFRYPEVSSPACWTPLQHKKAPEGFEHKKKKSSLNGQCTELALVSRQSCRKLAELGIIAVLSLAFLRSKTRRNSCGFFSQWSTVEGGRICNIVICFRKH
jgi:hypothetical protein